jgi:hypothetical protein
MMPPPGAERKPIVAATRARMTVGHGPYSVAKKTFFTSE